MKNHLFKNILKAGGLWGGLVLGAVSWYTLREYRPKKETPLPVPKGGQTLSLKDSFRLLTWNIGFAGFDRTMDFFMDGGKMVRPRNREQVIKNMKGIRKILDTRKADIYFLQEVDLDSYRSYRIDQHRYFERALGRPGIFAWNYKCDFIPYPFPPLGKMSSGLSTFTRLNICSARRLSLPESFSWPVKTCNLKRCILETRIPIEDSSRELVLFNFHLEAYDIIAGGDFNQIIKGEEKYPLRKSKNWTPGLLEKESLPPHFSIAADDTFPTCRLLDRPYDGSMEKGRVYVLDGFLVSDNLQISGVTVVNTDFTYTDHQPVMLEIRFL